MYWRLKKINPEQILKSYGVYAVCLVSVMFNLVAMTKMAPNKALNTEQKVNFDTFAKQVTRHITDGSFLTYESSMTALEFAGAKSELGPDVIRMLQQQEIIQPSFEATKAVARQLKDTKSVSAVSIDDVHVDDPNGQGLVPTEVSGKVVKHSAEGVMGPDYFRFRYLVGMRGTESPSPVVAKLEDLSGQPMPTLGSQQ